MRRASSQAALLSLWLSLSGVSAGLEIAGCSGASAPPSWYPPKGCADCYQGEGSGSSYSEALDRARAELCKDIAVVVESDSTDARRHVLRQSRDSTGREMEDAEFEELATIVQRTWARCVFDGNMPLSEQREDVGDASYVVLRVGIGEYRRYMEGRTVLVVVEASCAGVDKEGVGCVVAEHLRRSGYMVTRDVGRARLIAEVKVEVSLSEPASGFAGVRTAAGDVVYRMVRRSDGAEVESKQLRGVSARGFSEQALLEAFHADALKRLRAAFGIEEQAGGPAPR